MSLRHAARFVLLWLAISALPAAQTADDPVVRTAVERYYRALEAEDIDAYLALWSSAAPRPHRESLKYLFDSADERYFDIQILRAVTLRDRLRVRISLRRERTRPGRGPGAPPLVQSIVSDAALTFVKEGDDWKVRSEGTPADDLAAALVDAATPDEREALMAAEPDLVNTSLVVALARIATNAAAMRAYPRAQILFEQVLQLARRTGSRKEEGEALQNLGSTLYFQRKFPEALAAYEQRFALERSRGDDAAAAAALGGIATIRYSLAEYTEALNLYRESLAIQERLHNRYGSASTLISTGNVRYLQGDYAGAIRDYSRSRDRYRELADPGSEARALEGLGRTYLARGDYAAALSAFAGVLAEGVARGDRVRQASALQSIADVHLRLGNLDAARTHYERSRDHLVALKQDSSAGRVWQGLGMTELRAARFEAAEQAYTRSASVCAAADDQECRAHAVVGVAFAQFAQDKFAEAVATYRKAIEAFTGLGLREAAARAEVGRSQALLGNNEARAALDAAARAKEAAVALGNDDVLWRALMAEARALRKTDVPSNALTAARAAADVVERMHVSALEKPSTAIPSDASSVFALLAVLQAETGEATGAWSSASRMRAIDLRAILAVNERDIVRGMTADEREEERVKAGDLLSLLAQAARERTLPKPDAERLKRLEERIAASTQSRRAWMQELYERLPDLPIWRGMISPDSSAGAANLTGGTVVLDTVVDDDDVLVVVASATPERSVNAYRTEVRRRTLAERINGLLSGDTLRTPAEWRKAAGEITRLLPAAAIAALESAARIIVVPHDVLWRVPFEALPLGDGYLGDRAEISYAGSLTALARASAAGHSAGSIMFGLSAPELTPTTRDRLQQTAPGWALRDHDSAAREVAAAAAVYGEDSVILSGPAATERAFRDTAPAASVLHVGAPFRINSASPLFSPILLSGDESRTAGDDDGVLETREVMNLDLTARVAILSDGAATSMRDGAAAADAVQWAWLAAGVPSIVLSRWSADPAASQALMTELHRQLRKGSEPAVALDAARMAVRRRAEWSAPFYWAGWMALGR